MIRGYTVNLPSLPSSDCKSFLVTDWQSLERNARIFYGNRWKDLAGDQMNVQRLRESRQLTVPEGKKLIILEMRFPLWNC